MNNLIKISILISACAAFLSCGSPRTVMHSWVGNTENELYQRWGKPVKMIDKGRDGRNIYAYKIETREKALSTILR